jgi:hypothetical protein
MWPPYIVSAFEKINPESEEAIFYGPWNSVLNYCFPITEGYIICPQYPVAQVHKGVRDTIDFVITSSVMRNDATLFFVAVKAPKYLGDMYSRKAADEQMRLRFYQLIKSSPSKMFGISAFGTKVCSYRAGKGKFCYQPSSGGRVFAVYCCRCGTGALVESQYTRGGGV